MDLFMQALINKKVPKPAGTLLCHAYLLTDIIEERVFTVQRVFLSGANVDVSIRIGAVLGRPTRAPIPSSDLGNVISNHHDMFII